MGFFKRNKNRLSYLLLILFSLLYIIIEGGFVPYTIFMIVVFSAVISIIWAYITKANLKFAFSKHSFYVEKEETFKYDLKFSNESMLLFSPVKIFLKKPLGISANIEDFSMVLYPFSQYKKQISYKYKYRGIYEFGIDRIEITDFFGLVKLSQNIINKSKITVLPKIVPVDINLNTGIFINEKDDFELNKKGCSQSLLNIREYNSSDATRDIHWKLSAKFDSFMVKEYTKIVDSRTHILIDMTKKPNIEKEHRIEIEDMLIEYVLSTIYEIVQKNSQVYVKYQDDNLVEKVIKNINDFKGLYHDFAKIQFSDQVKVSSIIDIYLSQAFRQGSLIIYTLNLNYELLESIKKAAFSGYQVTLMYVSKGFDLDLDNEISYDELNEIMVQYGVKLCFINDYKLLEMQKKYH